VGYFHGKTIANPDQLICIPMYANCWRNSRSGWCGLLPRFRDTFDA
jgi:hypothetical protein